VKLFYDSGIRYAVIVSKHHDGFCMFDTKVPFCSEYSVMKAAPFGRDYVKEIFGRLPPRRSEILPLLFDFALVESKV